MHTLYLPAVMAAVFVVPLSLSHARADVYRCVLEGGHISYQQTPCSRDSRPMALKDRRSGWSALRPGEKELLKSYQEKYTAQQPGASVPEKTPRKESVTCWNKRKQLEAVRETLRRGYRLKDGDKLHRQRDNHEDYLRKFCS